MGDPSAAFTRFVTADVSTTIVATSRYGYRDATSTACQIPGACGSTFSPSISWTCWASAACPSTGASSSSAASSPRRHRLWRDPLRTPRLSPQRGQYPHQGRGRRHVPPLSHQTRGSPAELQAPGRVPRGLSHSACGLAMPHTAARRRLQHAAAFGRLPDPASPSPGASALHGHAPLLLLQWPRYVPLRHAAPAGEQRYPRRYPPYPITLTPRV